MSPSRVRFFEASARSPRLHGSPELVDLSTVLPALLIDGSVRRGCPAEPFYGATRLPCRYTIRERTRAAHRSGMPACTIIVHRQRPTITRRPQRASAALRDIAHNCEASTEKQFPFGDASGESYRPWRPWPWCVELSASSGPSHSSSWTGSLQHSAVVEGPVLERDPRPRLFLTEQVDLVPPEILDEGAPRLINASCGKTNPSYQNDHRRALPSADGTAAATAGTKSGTAQGNKQSA